MQQKLNSIVKQLLYISVFLVFTNISHGQGAGYLGRSWSVGTRMGAFLHYAPNVSLHYITGRSTSIYTRYGGGKITAFDAEDYDFREVAIGMRSHLYKSFGHLAPDGFYFNMELKYFSNTTQRYTYGIDEPIDFLSEEIVASIGFGRNAILFGRLIFGANVYGQPLHISLGGRKPSSDGFNWVGGSIYIYYSFSTQKKFRRKKQDKS